MKKKLKHLKKIIAISSIIILISLSLFFYVLKFFHQSNAFKTLAQVSKYASTSEEFPQMLNKDFLKPDFSSFYIKTYNQNWFDFIWKNNWNPNSFMNLLSQVTKYRESNGFSENEILKMTSAIGTKFIILGDLQGAFHSFVRDLNEIKRLGIINDNLEIIQPNYCFIFNGDLVNRSPYILETLYLALLLMHKNPDKVFYLRGNHESEEKMEFGLGQELTYKMKSASKNFADSKKDILKFFNTLPLCLYLTTDNKNFVKIYNQENIPLEDNNFEKFLTQNTHGLQKFGVSSMRSAAQEQSENKLKINSIIKSVRMSQTHVSTKGLVQLPSDQGITRWYILSSPTTTYQMLHDFFYDAFVILETTETINWKLTLYNRDIREKSEFKATQNYLLPTTAKTTVDYSNI